MSDQPKPPPPPSEDNVTVEAAGCSSGITVTVQVIVEPGARYNHKLVSRLNSICMEQLAERPKDPQ